MKTRLILTAATMLVSCSGPIPEKQPEPVALVQLTTAKAGQVADSMLLYGAVEAGPGSERTLAAVSEAIVVSINAPAGTSVAPQTLVVQLTPSPQAALDRSKARSDAVAADNAYARAQRLMADGLVSNAEVDAARATAAAADATRTSLHARSGALTLYARVNGVVDAVLAKPGDLVAAGAPIVRIATGSATRARFGVDPAVARGISPGSVLRVQSAAGGPEISVPLSGVHQVVDPTTRLAALFANLPLNAGFALGEPIKASLVRSGQSGVVIPYAAVQDDGGTAFVYVVNGGVAHKHEVKLGAQSGADVVVLAGIGVGDQIVSVGGTAVEDGMKVRTNRLKSDDPSADKGKE